MRTPKRSLRTVSGDTWLRLEPGSWNFVVAVSVLCLAVSAWLSGCSGVPKTAGGGSGNPMPSLANGSLNPSSAAAGSAAFALTVTGSNFVSSSTVQWNGSPRTTTFGSSTSLQAAITAADMATPGTATVTVMNPAPGGGTSSALTFTINNPAPTATSLNPTSAQAGGAAFTLKVAGTGFISSSTVQWNGSPRTTTFVSSTSLQAAITAADIATNGTASVTVMNPAPGGGTSSALSFTIGNPVPTATSMNPNTLLAGGAAFTLTVTGTNFISSSVVQWNASARTTTFVSSTSLQAAITAADIATAGTATVTVMNPTPGGGTSSGLSFTIASFVVTPVNQAAQDIVFDSVNNVIYLSVPGTAATNGNTISILDPATGAITSSVPAGSNPDVLAISGDSSYLYAGLDGASSVQRFILPGVTKDISYSLGSNATFGPYIALDLQVAPGTPHTTAVSLGNTGVSPRAQGGVEIFDDGTARPTIAPGNVSGGGLFDSLQWGANANTLYAANNETSSFDFYTLTVNSSGVTRNQDFPNVFSVYNYRIHYDSGTNLVYADEGHVVNPATGAPVGNFSVSGGVMVPDSTLNTAFFAVGSLGSSNVTIESFNLTTFTKISSITIPNVTGTPLRLIRWGQNGLAFNTGGTGVNGQVYLVQAELVTKASSAIRLEGPPTPVLPPAPAANAPAISQSNPSSALAGGASFRINVSGTNFVPSSTVQWNGSPRATTFVSSTQLQAAIASADIASPGAVSITVSNPAENGGVSAPSSFFVGASGGISSAGTEFAVSVVNQTSKDIAFDRKNQVFYLSVPNTVPNGNTISVLDPVTLKIVGEQFAGSNPNILAISDDSRFLYAGIDGSSFVQRFTLPYLGIDVNYSLDTAGFSDPQFAQDLAVAPGAPHTTAVAARSFSLDSNARAEIKIFDDTTARATGLNPQNADHLCWGADATSLFTTGELSPDLSVLFVDSNSVSVNHDYVSVIGDTRVHFDLGTKLIYSDNGRVVDPTTGASVGNFNTSGLMVPDSTLNRAFFLVGPFGSSTLTLESFDLKTFALAGSVTIPNVTGTPQRLVRWGQNGLAFNTNGGQIVLIGGNFVH